MKHQGQRRQGRNHDRALTVGAILYMNGRQLPASTDAGRHRAEQGE